MSMARKTLVLKPNSGTEGPLLHFQKVASSESSASEKAEDTGDRICGTARHLRTSSAHPGYLAQFVPVTPRAVDDTVLDYDSGYDYTSTSSFEFHKGDRGGILASYLNKGAPSKWDDAEKWLVSPSPTKGHAKPRTRSGPLCGQGIMSSAMQGLAKNPQEWPPHSQTTKRGNHSSVAALVDSTQASLLVGVGHRNHMKLISTLCNDDSFESSAEWNGEIDAVNGLGNGACMAQNFAFTHIPPSPSKVRSVDGHPLADELDDTKEVAISHEESYNDAFLKPMLQTRKLAVDPDGSASPYVMPAPAVRSVSMRDMGTEMTPIASQEPSRTGTPIRATTPTARSPVSSCSSTPGGASPAASPTQEPVDSSFPDFGHKGTQVKAGRELHVSITQPGKVDLTVWSSKEEEDADASKLLKTIDLEEVKKNVLETRAAAWEEAEKAKFIARFKQEEAKIQAWENHQKAKAEAEMRRIEIKVERTRSCAHEKLMRKMAAARRKAEERRASAEAKKCEQAAKTAESADYIRRTGRMPTSFFSCGLCG